MPNLVAGPATSIYSSYWKAAPGGHSDLSFDVLVARDVELEAGFEPTVEKSFATYAEAQAYVNKWQPLYDETVFFIA